MRAPDFWNRRGMVARALAPLGTLHGLSVALKARLAHPSRSSARVICVGNLTAGGSGKTPVAIAVAKALIARGEAPFFLTRGYGGRARGPTMVHAHDDAIMVGDEALLLARVAPTVVARNRAAGAALAVANGARLIVMDDGHQNFTLAKNLSMVVVDGTTAFANGFMIPAGPLRESVARGLQRADAVVVMGDGAPDLENYAGPVLRARLVPQGGALAGRHVFAFAGIGKPEKFLASLREAGAIVTGTRFFPDHHPYSAREIATLRRDAADMLLVTTEKDLIRLAPEARDGIATLPVVAQFDDDALLDRLLATV